MYALAVPNHSISQSLPDSTWLFYFDRVAAFRAVLAHLEALPSARTPERHTHRAYLDGLKYFMRWAGDELPTAALIEQFIAHLSARGLKPNTISSKYLAPVRLYLKRLSSQPIAAAGTIRDFVSDCRDHIRAAADVKSPRSHVTSNISPLWSPQFTRLSLNQVNAVLRSIDRSTRAGLRDYALLHIAFSSALRLAELHRITLAAIQPHADAYLITVRGKRSNIDPVPISAAAYRDLVAWVERYNADLPVDDPRRIGPSSPVWQPLLHGDNYAHVGINRYDPARGMSQGALRDIIARRTAAALGEQWALAAHDTRRTAAAIAYDAGMPLPDLQALLRHRDAAVTLRYVGTKPNFDQRALSRYVTFG